MNYFQLFNFIKNFLINKNELEDRLFELQALYHPDKYINASPLEKQISIENSSIINKAYKTLKDPLLRASYLLELQGISIEKEEIPQHLLIESMEWREQLEEAQTIEDTTILLSKTSKIEEDCLTLLKDKFIKELYNEVLSVYIKLKFLIRYKKEIIDKIDSFNETT
jgi:molecular chaperone HscB